MRFLKLWDDLRATLWLRPTIWTIGLGLLAVALVWFEKSVVPFGTESVLWFFAIGAEGARTMLGAISTSMLTVTTLVFSVTMVAVVQTSNAYSPRILREYLSDTSNHHVMGILIGTFLYALLVLLSVESGEENPFIPLIATNGALLLSVLCLGAFIYFLDHAAHSIKVNNMISLILEETHPLAAEPFPKDLGESLPPDTKLPSPGEPVATLRAPGSGYVEFFVGVDLLHIAQEQDLVIHLVQNVGGYVLPDMPLAHVYAAARPADEVVEKISKAVEIGSEQTLVQDVLYGIRQLSDIALRALSAGINDPTTAMACIDALSVLVDEFVTAAPVSPYRCDPDGQVRLIAPTIPFELALEEAFGQIRRYGATDVTVVMRLLQLCADLGQRAERQSYRDTIWRFALELTDAADRTIGGAADRQRVNQSFGRVAALLGRSAGAHLLDPRQPPSA